MSRTVIATIVTFTVSMKRSNLHLTLTIAVMLFIFVQSALPGDISGVESNFIAKLLAAIFGLNAQSASFMIRKAAHFTEYTVLGICLGINASDYRARRNDILTQKTLPQLVAWIIGVLYAATDELHQLFVEGRSCEFRDLCIDAAGVALGVLAISLIHVIRSDK